MYSSWLMQEATAASLGTSCATCKPRTNVQKEWLNVILLEESEGKHRSVESFIPTKHKMSVQSD
jgi:cell division protein FtsL